jgi:hypothetical protein
MTMVRSITSQPTSFSRLRACEGEISWSTRMTSMSRKPALSVAFSCIHLGQLGLAADERADFLPLADTQIGRWYRSWHASG